MKQNTLKKDKVPEPISAEIQVGRKLRELRSGKGYSLRALADRCELNVNTLSLIENGKTSPSVSTLQQLALGLDVPIAAFFDEKFSDKQVVFFAADQGHVSSVGSTRLQNLGEGLINNAVQPFVVTLNPGLGSGERMIVHTGHEFVYCLEGSLRYQIQQEDYVLHPGDSLLFQSHLPHCWENNGSHPAKVLLVLIPADLQDEFGGRHFSIEFQKKDINMKIAAITDDGKSISQHFGRAPYYLVLTIEEGKVVEQEMREKMGHTHFQAQHAGESHDSSGHGRDAESHNKHVSMAEVISDCACLLCGGMGMGAYESMRQLNIKPIVTDIADIETAVQAFIDGKLIDHTELLH